MVSPREKIRVEKLPGETGSEISFDKVLLVSGDERELQIGKPFVGGVKVIGKVLAQARAKKISMLKYHSKTRYRRRKGHRQDYTEIEIKSIV